MTPQNHLKSQNLEAPQILLFIHWPSSSRKSY